MDITPRSDLPIAVEIKFDDAVAFLEEVAGDWKCVVCRNNEMNLYTSEEDGSIPAHVRMDQNTGGLISFRSFISMCARCGFVHLFDLAPFLIWKNKRDEAKK